MAENDFEFVNNTFKALAERKQQRGETSIDDIERVVLLVWHASGIIENGGFRYFFECNLPLRQTSEAYSRIGVEEVATILSRVQELFPNRDIPDDYDERMAIVEGIYENQGDLLSNLESEFYRADGLMEQQLAGWIRVHKDVFTAEQSDGKSEKR